MPIWCASETNSQFPVIPANLDKGEGFYGTKSMNEYDSIASNLRIDLKVRESIPLRITWWEVIS